MSRLPERSPLVRQAPATVLALFGLLALMAGCSAPASPPASPLPSPTAPPTEASPTVTSLPPPSATATAPPTPTPQGNAQPSPPGIRLGNETIDEWIAGQLGSYCWSADASDGGEASGVCRQAPPPPLETPLPVVAAARARLELEEPLPDRVTLDLYRHLSEEPISSDEQLPRGEDDTLFWIAPEGAAGEHILVVMAVWEGRGHTLYYFPVTISAYDPRARVPRLFLVVDGEKFTGKLQSACWIYGCGDGQPVVEHFVSILRGQAITLESEALAPESLSLKLYEDPDLYMFAELGPVEPAASTQLAPGGTVATWSVDLPKGYYVLSAVADYGDYGETHYLFGLILPPRR